MILPYKSVYTNRSIPNNWKTRLGYREDLLKIIGDDSKFCDYLVKMNGANALESLGNGKINEKHDVNNKDKNFNNKNIHTNLNSSHNYVPNNNHVNNLKKSTKKNLIEVNSSINSSDFIKQINNQKDQNESIQITRKQTNVNVTPMDMVTSFNEKLDLNNYNNELNTVVKTSNNNNPNLNPISETKYKHDEDDIKYSPRKTISKNFGSPRKFNSTASTVMTDKEKRAVLEHFRNLYSFKKQSPTKNSPTTQKSNNINRVISSFPLISQYAKKDKFYANEKTIGNNNDIVNNSTNKNMFTNKTSTLFYESKNKNSFDYEENLISTKKNSMFRSSIYSNLMPTNSKEFSNKRFQSLQKNNIYYDLNETENDLAANKIAKNKSKNNNSHQTTYGPFLHIDNKYSKKIEIKNPEIKRSLEDINYYGPYFSHCPICRFKNLDFYQTMEPHQCLKLLNYIKMKRSNIKLK